jgi:hypothetical protein
MSPVCDLRRYEFVTSKLRTPSLTQLNWICESRRGFSSFSLVRGLPLTLDIDTLYSPLLQIKPSSQGYLWNEMHSKYLPLLCAEVTPWSVPLLPRRQGARGGVKGEGSGLVRSDSDPGLAFTLFWSCGTDWSGLNSNWILLVSSENKSPSPIQFHARPTHTHTPHRTPELTPPPPRLISTQAEEGPGISICFPRNE